MSFKQRLALLVYAAPRAAQYPYGEDKLVKGKF